jgi:hypothetical protein
MPTLHAACLQIMRMRDALNTCLRKMSLKHAFKPCLRNLPTNLPSKQAFTTCLQNMRRNHAFETCLENMPSNLAREIIFYAYNICLRIMSPIHALDLVPFYSFLNAFLHTLLFCLFVLPMCYALVTCLSVLL